MEFFNYKFKQPKLKYQRGGKLNTIRQSLGYLCFCFHIQNHILFTLNTLKFARLKKQVFFMNSFNNLNSFIKLGENE